jgi:hypothetical protein
MTVGFLDIRLAQADSSNRPFEKTTSHFLLIWIILKIVSGIRRIFGLSRFMIVKDPLLGSLSDLELPRLTMCTVCPWLLNALAKSGMYVAGPPMSGG